MLVKSLAKGLVSSQSFGLINDGGTSEPYDISTLSPDFWYEGDNYTTSGANVTQWTDLSGNANHATASTNHPQTGGSINGYPGITFNGTSQYMTLPTSLLAGSGFTVYAVYVQTNISTERNILANNGTGGAASRLFVGAQFVDTEDMQLERATWVADETIVQAVWCDDATGYTTQHIKCNNEPKISAIVNRATAGTAFKLGSYGGTPAAYFAGTMCAVVGFNRVLTDAEKNQLGAYFASKYGASWSTITTKPIASQVASSSTFIGFGDSITNGFGLLTPADDRWGVRMAGLTGLTFTNEGINSTPMQDTIEDGTGLPFTDNGVDRFVADLAGAAKKDMVVIMYGLNDMGRDRNDAEYSLWSITEFETDYQTVVDGLQTRGYAADDLILCTLPYIKEAGYEQGSYTGGDSELHEDYNGVIADIAYNEGCLFYDAYFDLKYGGGDKLIDSDGVHTQINGHAMMGDGIARATVLTASAPVNIIAPSYTGSLLVGQVLTASKGYWSGVPYPTFTYQWLRDGVEISGATSSTYTLVSADIGASITVKITATNSEGTATATSASLGTVSDAVTPDDLSNKIAWWSARDAATITESSGNVTAIADKYNSNDATLVSGATNPTIGTRTQNGLDLIDHTTTGIGSTLAANYTDLFNVTNSESWIIIAGVKDIASSTSSQFVGGEQSGGGDSLSVGQVGTAFRFRSGSSFVSAAGDDEDFHIFAAHRASDGTINFYIDGGTSVGSAATTNRTLVNFTIGAINEAGSDDLDGAWGDIVVVGNNSLTNINGVGQYFAALYGTTWTDIS